MPANFPKYDELVVRYSQIGDSKLHAMYLNQNDYSQEAVLAMEQCLKSRNLSTEGPTADWTDIRIEREQLDVEDAGPAIKIVFFLFPPIGILVNLVWFFVALFGKSDPRVAQTIHATTMGILVWSIFEWFNLAVNGSWYFYSSY